MKILNHITILFIVFFSSLITSCESPQNTQPPLSQLQIREMQTRHFAGADMKAVMKAMINVLQDEGFIIEHADKELGLVRGQKTQDIEKSSQKMTNIFLFGENNARWNKVRSLKASANISEYGNELKVRIIFELSQMDNTGAIQKIHAIDDETFYQEFFSKIDKSLFLSKEGV